MVKDMAKRTNRSKYNFGKLNVGESFMVKPIDLHSMKVSLNAFNRKHSSNIQIDEFEISDSEIQITRIA